MEIFKLLHGNDTWLNFQRCFERLAKAPFRLTSTAAQIGYRSDIDGLRAIAVMSVVLFHAYPTTLQGGFVGVDIFFVISGYLIGGIVLREMDNSNFSFRDFFARRAVRIFPALIAILLATYFSGWFMLLAPEYEQLGLHIAGGAGFVANFVSWSEAGYFDNAALSKPLQHLWSLGIEEQFYIFWPILLVLTSKWLKKIPFLIVCLAVTSFLASCVYVHRDSIAAFYSPVLRFWELLAGNLLAYFSLRAPDFTRLRAFRVRPYSA